MQIDAPISFFILFWVNPAQFFFFFLQCRLKGMKCLALAGADEIYSHWEPTSRSSSLWFD